MSALSVEAFVAQQEKYAWRRKILNVVLRQVGFRFLAKVEASGLDNVPLSGPTILMMNHISLLDPFACVGVITKRLVVPMSKIENMRLPVFSTLFRWYGIYTVNRGEVDRKALMNSVELLKSGQMILLAPEGTRHPEGLSRPKDGLAWVATKADATILPAAVSGKVDFKARWKRLKRAQVHVSFGRPFKFKADGQKRVPRDILQKMMDEAMYQLALAQPDSRLRGVYSDLSQVTTEYLEFVET